ncbi:hypothetical protein CCR95_14325 [Thiocystis minor]|nr:hypothetical protein [Thiocystis minor]
MSEIGRPSPLSGDDSISLFEAAILLGYRLKGSPWALIGKAPIRFAEWFLSGQIDPREPGSLVPFSKLPFIAPVDLQDEPRIPDMTWRLWPRDIDRLALAIWGETIFQEQDGVSDQAPAPTINQAPAPTQKPKRGLNEGTLLRITGALVCALADTDPERLKHEDGKRSIALKKKNGSINLGTAKETGDTGVVGYLTANGYTTLTRSTLEKYLSEASKADP